MATKKIKRKKPNKCYFCENGGEPNYKDVLILRRFVSDRGRVLSADKTGICSKHQRKLSTAIKNARIMALLPYTDRHTL
jgi:small subunit ribosomal protein S18